MFLPSMAKGTGPFPNTNGRWRFEPETIGARRAAVSLYQVLMTATCLEMIGARGPIVVEGPFAANPIFLVGLSGLTKRSVYALASRTGTAAGAAMLAGFCSKHSLRLVDEKIAGLDQYAETWRSAIASGH